MIEVLNGLAQERIIRLTYLNAANKQAKTKVTLDKRFIPDQHSHVIPECTEHDVDLYDVVHKKWILVQADKIVSFEECARII